MRRLCPVSSKRFAGLLLGSWVLALGRLAAAEGFSIDQQRLTPEGGTSGAGTFSLAGRVQLKQAGLTLAGGAFSLQGDWTTLAPLAAAALSAVNGPPTPGTLAVQGDGGRPVKVYLSRLLEGAHDPDGDVLRVSGVTALSANGAEVSRQGLWLIYDPAGGSLLPDTVTYELTDEQSTVTGSFTIEQRPEGGDPGQNQLGMRLAGGDAVVEFAGIPNRSYRVQATSALGQPWEELGTVTADRFGRLQFTEVGGAAHATRYYRTRTP